MGKLYESELYCLNQTYQWAHEAPIEELSSFIEASHDSSLIAIGSGGSLTAAQMAAILHQKAGKISKGVTPLEFVHLGRAVLDSSVLILTSRGNNADILSAYRHAANAEPRRLMAICMKKHSPLSRLSQEFKYTRFVDFELPSEKDGFLATNSLLASNRQ
jgi:fructoselysine-6-P-deglycase FrlB-like protein